MFGAITATVWPLRMPAAMRLGPAPADLAVDDRRVARMHGRSAREEIAGRERRIVRRIALQPRIVDAGARRRLGLARGFAGFDRLALRHDISPESSGGRSVDQSG
jgi:hypothetical protein